MFMGPRAREVAQAKANRKPHPRHGRPMAGIRGCGFCFVGAVGITVTELRDLISLKMAPEKI